MAEYYNIGKFVAVHGLQGELLLKHELGKKTSLKGLSALFVEEKKNSFLPWFIESTKIKSEEEIYIKLEGVNTREAAMKLTQKPVWLPETDFKKFAAKTAPASLLGYTIIEQGIIRRDSRTDRTTASATLPAGNKRERSTHPFA